jgi:SAM-dependent methyltransferase
MGSDSPLTENTLSQDSNPPSFFQKELSLNFSDFRKIGRESYLRFKNPIIRSFISLFGPLGVNSRIRNGHVLNLIQKLNLTGALTILDAGCGLGYSSFWLAQNNSNYQIRAIDTDHKAIVEGGVIARQMGLTNISFEALDLTQLREEQKYDLIYSMDVLEHIPDDLAALNVLRRSIKPTGWLILHLPKKYSECKRYLPGFESFETKDHVREEYTCEEIRSKLEKAHFQPVYLKYGYNWRGEIAFELNYLFWQVPILRLLFAFLTHFVTTWLAYLEVSQEYETGNSFIILAKPV